MKRIMSWCFIFTIATSLLWQPARVSAYFAAPAARSIGQLAGDSYAITILGNYAFLGSGPRVLVVDISDPARPQVKAQTAVMRSVVRGIAVSNGVAYVAAGDLYTFNISDPLHPTLSGSFTQLYDPYGLAVSGTYVYVADSSQGLVVVDVSYPARPSLAKILKLTGYAEQVAIEGNYAYVVSGEGGLRIVSIATPTQPVEVAYYDTYTSGYKFANAVFVQNHIVYFTDLNEGLRIVDVTTPASPHEIGFFLDVIPSVTPSGSVIVNDGVAFLSGQRVMAVNVSTPSSPTKITEYETPGASNGTALSGSNLFVADWSGLSVLDFHDGLNLTQVIDVPMPGRVENVAVSGNYAYLSDFWYGLHVVDLSDPADPTLVSSTVTKGGQYGGDGASWVTVSGEYAYVSGSSNGIEIYSLADPTTPVLVGSFNTSDRVNRIFVSGDMAYLAASSQGLVILDISKKASPVQKGSDYLPVVAGRTTYLYGVTVVGSTAYLSCDNAGLVVANVSNPASIWLMGAFVAPNNEGIRETQVAGNRAYAGGTNNFYVLNVTDPSSPGQLGALPVDMYVTGIALKGSTALVSIFGSMVYVSIADPSNPRPTSVFYAPGEAFGVAIYGEYACLADGDAGFSILKPPAMIYLPLVRN